MKNIITTKNSFKDDVLLTPFLSELLYNSKLCIVLGSGISKPFGSPSWDELIQNMQSDIGITDIPGTDNKTKAETIRLKIDNIDQYKELIKKHLYNNTDFSLETLQQNKTLAAISSLIMSSIRGNVTDVVTLNYDDILERYLKYHGFKVTSKSQFPFWNSRCDIRISHPHGYLPSLPTEPDSDFIVLDKKSYNDTRIEIWHTELLPIFLKNFCLFIGLSDSDDNLDKLLLNVFEQKVGEHPALQEKIPYWGIRFQSKPEDTDRQHEISKSAEERGIYVKYINDYKTDLHSFLFKICQEAANIG